MPLKWLHIPLLLSLSTPSFAQTDSPNITQVPLKFITQSNKKIDSYCDKLHNNTLKTLKKLAEWEGKIKTLLQKTSPAVAEELFNGYSASFASMLAQIENGQQVANQATASYSEYTDKLITHIKYVDSKKQELHTKYTKPLEEAKKQIATLDSTTAQSEAIEKLIAQRKQQLLTAAYQALGKNKYLKKIHAETTYYTDALKEYKAAFTQPKLLEQKIIQGLQRIPAVQNFVQQNSMLASLFGPPSSANKVVYKKVCKLDFNNIG